MPTNTLSNQWLIFIGVLLAVGLVAIGIILWLFRPPAGGKKHNRRRKRRQHHRQVKPTLAETGGLPPMRPPNEPPRGA